MKTTEAMVSKSEIDLFKQIQAEPDGSLGKGEYLRKRKVKVKRKVQAKDHSRLNAALRQTYGDNAITPDGNAQTLDELNSHGAMSGDAAFGPGSHDQKGPPPQGAINQRELKRKQRLLAEQSKKGFGVGAQSDTQVDAIRKIHQRGPSGRI